MRAGAGYVTALVPASLNLVFEQRLLEVMTVPLPDERRRAARRPALRGRCSSAPSAPMRSCSGPGSAASRGRSSWPASSPRPVEIPLLLDADGLNAHAGRLEALAERDRRRPC